MKVQKKIAIFLNIGIGDFIWGTSVIPIIKSFDKNIKIILFTRKITSGLINKEDVYKTIKLNPGRFKTKNKLKRFFYKYLFIIFNFCLLYKIDSAIFFDDTPFIPKIAKSIFKIKNIYGPDIKCFGYDLKNPYSKCYTNAIKMPKNMNLFHCMMRYQLITRKIFPTYNLSLPKLVDTSYIYPKIKKLIQTNKKHKIMICTKGAAAWRYWPTDYFIKLIEMINSEYKATFFIIGNSKEQFDVANQIKKKLMSTDIRNLCNKTSLLELKEMFKYMNLLISVDSSAIHFAATYNIPTISFHGQTLPERSRPVNYNAIAMCSYRDCSPCDVACFVNNTFCKKPECMYDLTPEQVFKNVKKLLI